MIILGVQNIQAGGHFGGWGIDYVVRWVWISIFFTEAHIFYPPKCLEGYKHTTRTRERDTITRVYCKQPWMYPEK